MSNELQEEKVIEAITKKILGLKTLDARNSDSLDFHELSVWQIKKALEQAYRNGYHYGYQDGQNSMDDWYSAQGNQGW